MFIQLIPPLVVAVVSVTALFFYPTTAVITLTSLAVLSRWLRKASTIGLYKTVDALYSAQTVLKRVRDRGASEVSSGELQTAIAALDRLIERLKSASETWFLRGSVDARYNAVMQAELYVKVLQAASVQTAMQKTGATDKDVLKILRSLSRSQSSVLMTILGPVLRLCIRILFPLGIQISDESIRRLRAAVYPDGSLKRSRPVLLLPCHKSHVDYMIVHLLAMNYSLPVPLCIAGDNLNMPVIGWVFQKSGAVFIRRAFGNDALYQAVFKEHTVQLLRQNHLLECFIEGGRSRSGKLLPPKIGFLKSVVETVLDVQSPVETDVLIVPISISYDRIVEGPSHIAELTGGVKTPEKFWSAIHTAVSLLHLAYRRLVFYGRVDVSVAQPISIRQHFAEKSSSKCLSPRLDPSVPEQQKKTLTQQTLSLGFKNMHAINEVSAILPTMLVGTVLLLNGTARALAMERLIEQVVWLSREIEERGGCVATVGTDNRSVDQAVNLVVDRIMGMGSSRNRLIKKHKSFIMTGLFTPLERMELATYRNSLIHIFVIEAILCSAFNASGSARVSVKKLREDALFLSALLKLEFIFRPATLETNFNAAIDTLEKKLIFARFHTPDGEELLELVEPAQHNQLWKFLLSLVAPFVDAYYVLALSSLNVLTSAPMPQSASQSTIVANAQQLAEQMFFEEKINAYEAVAKDTLQNAVSVFIEDGSFELVTISGVSGDKPVRLQISVDEFQAKIDKINYFRFRQVVSVSPPTNSSA